MRKRPRPVRDAADQVNALAFDHRELLADAREEGEIVNTIDKIAFRIGPFNVAIGPFTIHTRLPAAAENPEVSS